MLHKLLIMLPIALSVVRADYYQGSECFSEETRARQCMPNCLVFLTYTRLKPISHWVKNDLHTILHAGDSMYADLKHRGLGRYDYLMISDLPEFFSLNTDYFAVKCPQSHAGPMLRGFRSDGVQFSLENAFSLTFASTPMAILILNINAMAVFRDGDHYHVFDPHSRNGRGLSEVDGACIVSTFSSFPDLCSFLRFLALSLGSSGLLNTQFELNAVTLQSLKYSTFKRKRDVCCIGVECSPLASPRPGLKDSIIKAPPVPPVAIDSTTSHIPPLALPGPSLNDVNIKAPVAIHSTKLHIPPPRPSVCTI